MARNAARRRNPVMRVISTYPLPRHCGSKACRWGGKPKRRTSRGLPSPRNPPALAWIVRLFAVAGGPGKPAMHVAGGPIIGSIGTALAGRAAADIVDAIAAIVADALRIGAGAAEAGRVARCPMDLGRLVHGRITGRGGEGRRGQEDENGERYELLHHHLHVEREKGSTALVAMEGQQLG
jgi:hypothetical protein